LRRLLRLRPRCRGGRETHPCGTPNEYRVPRGFSVVPTHRGTENVRKRTVIVRNRDAHPIRAVRKLHVSRPDNSIPIQEPRPKASPCEYKRFMITPHNALYTLEVVVKFNIYFIYPCIGVRASFVWWSVVVICLTGLFPHSTNVKYRSRY